ncbi:MAG TPA: TIGR03862 family flavoprotein, partial [Flavobacteriales bacterium]|nr:TIGR03862 family flavoprotein [Flavobacteriales bacterium]
LGFLDGALTEFGSQALREWLKELGVETYVGTSGRVFPAKGIKPIDALKAIRSRLIDRGVHFHLEHSFVGFDGYLRPIVEHEGERSSITSEITLFALGGASWPVTGSTGTWKELFAPLGVEVAPFRPSNCGVEIPWPQQFVAAHAGKALKNIVVSIGDHSRFGEATITEHGLEGNAIYPLVPAIRDALQREHSASVSIDLKPNNSEEQLLGKVASKEPKNYGEAINLDRPTLALLKAYTTKDQFLSPFAFVRAVKDLQLNVTALRPIEEAISTVGGISAIDLAPDFSFRGHPQFFALGEMVDWDAPTGGFLLQGCFAMGHHAAQAVIARLH